jgi:hypothetical protein
MVFFNLHHSGTKFFLENVDNVFDPEIRQLHSSGGGKRHRAKTIAVLTSAFFVMWCGR